MWTDFDDNAPKKEYFDSCVATFPAGNGRTLVILMISGGKCLSAYSDDDEPTLCYKKRWTKIRRYKPTDSFAVFIERDKVRIDLTNICGGVY